MATVRAFRVDGLKLVFFPRDHLPPHFHVIRTGEWEIRVYFLECTRGNLVYDQKRGRTPDRRVIRELLRQVLVHRVELLEEWQAKVNTEDNQSGKR